MKAETNGVPLSQKSPLRGDLEGLRLAMTVLSTLYALNGTKQY